MADNRAKNGREGSPLWANINTSSALSFSPGQFQPLLVPQGQTSTLHEGSRSQAQGANGHESKVDAGELQVDHFIGQESPGAAPPVSHSNSSTSLFAATSFTCEDSFDVGYGSAPPTHDSSLLNSFHTTADQQANPVSSHSSVSAPVSQYYQPTHQPPASVPGYETPQYTSQNTNYEASVENSTRAVPMYNPAQPVDAQSTVPSQIAVVHYSPVVHHWFYCKKTDGKPDSWKSFSYKDSMTLEESFLNGEVISW
ncbi:hypothetical protein EB796_016617 [Bugula neritina]|uniref:Uncharacterized protein n=1 Tax=Bugula neritina TaxID=10212 RepID=A0A7J7JGZ5_BUGNE|nr:hypothetical protein EB796_016617 [Bugula neritina]